MTTARCDYCGQDVDVRLLKPVPDWRDGGTACYACRGTESTDAAVCRDAWKEFDAVAEQDRIDAARWRALRPYLHCDERLVGTWLWMEPVMAAKGWAVEQAADMLVQIAQEPKP